LSAIPAGSRSDAGNSISSTYAAASQHAPAVAGQIMDASNTAFITAMHWASVGAAISAVIGIVIVVLYLPTKAALAAAAGGSTPNPTKSEPESELESLGEQFELADSGR
jgi:MFS transporter, DHA2 family, multidrug resistance protein